MPSSTATDPLAGLTPAQVRQVERTLRGVPPTFLEWCQRAWPQMRWDWPHLIYLCERLQRVADGECDRLLISMPPRHGKSWTATERFPVFMLHDNPSARVIVAAYNVMLARTFTRHSRGFAEHTGLMLSPDVAAADNWETTAGGAFRAAGVGTGVTGHGADLIVVDDPIKSHEEAESPLYRDKVWDWFTTDLWTRREPGCAVVVILTRWHQDDLIGRILADEEIGSQWEVINLPALAEANDPLGRAEGEALCPERYDEAALADIRRWGEYAFSALFQGNPVPHEGRMFPREQVQIVDAVPAAARHLRYWDKAGTKDGGDWTAGVRMASHEGLFYIADVVRVRLEALARRQAMRVTAELDGRNVPIRIEQEPGSGGKDSASDDVRQLAGWPVSAEPVSGDKVVRAMPLAAQWQAGNVRIVRGNWNKEYLDEMDSFPHAKHDDQVDASSGAFNKLTGAPDVYVV